MKKLIGFSVLFSMIVIFMGAYTRLSDAGLSCPDWPNCYGYATVTGAMQHSQEIATVFPERALEPSKAWLEMIHRYVAGALGGMILMLVVWYWYESGRRYGRPLLLLGLLSIQVLLGKLTVTLQLMPLVVMGHLLGGFSILSVLWLWFISKKSWHQDAYHKPLRRLLLLGQVSLGLLIVQIALGGWMAANYAALACTELPICEGDWWQRLNFKGALTGFLGAEGNYEFGVLDYSSRMTIHVVHRFGAVLASLTMLCFIYILLKHTSANILRRGAWVMLALLVAQVLLGLGNVLLHVPVTIAVAHNLMAALLLLSCIFLVFVLSQYSYKGVAHG
jgi:heme a synthase